MRKTLLNALAAFFAGGIGLAPAPSHAYALDAQFDCKTDAHAFIVRLFNHGDIDRDPMRVEQNSVNAFRPTRDAALTVFGFSVYAVFAYAQYDALFRQGAGQPLPGSIYGVVVKAPIESVEAYSRLSGSNAVAHQVIPFILTAVVCARP